MVLTLDIPGIVSIHPLKEISVAWEITTHDKEFNLGVFEALSRKHCYVLVHNSEFRGPEFPLSRTIFCGNKQICVLPSLPFPEIKRRNAVSGSPSFELDKYLRKLFNIKQNKELATLLVGFD